MSPLSPCVYAQQENEEEEMESRFDRIIVVSSCTSMGPQAESSPSSEPHSKKIRAAQASVSSDLLYDRFEEEQVCSGAAVKFSFETHDERTNGTKSIIVSVIDFPMYRKNVAALAGGI